MRTPFLALILLALAAGGAAAQNATTALSALRMVPRSDAKRLARIEAREGNLTPERWYFLLHDPQGENGLREFVIAGGEIAASRTLSQFAEAVRPEDVVGFEVVKLDSDRAARLALAYAQANGVAAASVNYSLRKDFTTNTPVWTVTCVDAEGKRIGEVVVEATKGTVISHGGFPREPAPERARPVREEDRLRDRTAPRRLATRETAPAPVRQAPPENNPLQKIGNSLQKLFGGGRQGR